MQRGRTWQESVVSSLTRLHAGVANVNLDPVEQVVLRERPTNVSHRRHGKQPEGPAQAMYASTYQTRISLLIELVEDEIRTHFRLKSCAIRKQIDE